MGGKVIQFPGDLQDSVSIENAIQEYQPDEFYNLAAQSHVGMSWKQPELTSKIDYLGVLNALKAIKLPKPDTRFYQASTSELFGKVVDQYQNEESRFYPRSQYAIAKLAAHWLTIITASRSTSTFPTEYSSILKLHEAVKILLLGR